MDDQLGAVVEVLDGMLPDEGAVVALVLDDAGEAVPADALGDQALLHVVLKVADRADVFCRALDHVQPYAALLAGEGLHLLLLRHGVDRPMADRAEGIGPLGLVEDDLVPAVGAQARRQLVGPDVDDIATGAFNLFLCKEARLRLGILAAHRARNRKLRHL